jgi:hypothetical protein
MWYLICCVGCLHTVHSVVFDPPIRTTSIAPLAVLLPCWHLSLLPSPRLIRLCQPTYVGLCTNPGLCLIARGHVARVEPHLQHTTKLSLRKHATSNHTPWQIGNATQFPRPTLALVGTLICPPGDHSTTLQATCFMHADLWPDLSSSVLLW